MSGQHVLFASLPQWLAHWQLTPDGAAFETPSSWLAPVLWQGGAAMLKVPKPASDEHGAAGYLRYIDGDGAVRLLASEPSATLIERVTGRSSLMAMATNGGDPAAAAILAGVVRRLHRPRGDPAPPDLIPLGAWFSALFEQEHRAPVLAIAATAARHVLATAGPQIPLHGDLHHDNVLDGATRGWIAIDPKALLGEAAYDIANLLRNPYPHGTIVHDTERMHRLAALYAGRLGLDRERVLAFALVHAGLSASWDLIDGTDPAFNLTCCYILAGLVPE